MMSFLCTSDEARFPKPGTLYQWSGNRKIIVKVIGMSWFTTVDHNNIKEHFLVAYKTLNRPWQFRYDKNTITRDQVYPIVLMDFADFEDQYNRCSIWKRPRYH